jgi:hypothetical protein
VDWRSYELWIADSFRRHGHRREAARRYLEVAARHRDALSVARAGGALAAGGLIDRLRRIRAGRAPGWLGLYGLDSQPSPPQG